MDLFSGNPFGLYTFCRPFIFCVAQLFKDRLYLEGFLSQFLLVFFAALVEGFFILILLSGLNPDPLGHLYPTIVNVFLPQSFFTGLIAPVLFSFFKKAFFPLLSRQGMG